MEKCSPYVNKRRTQKVVFILYCYKMTKLDIELIDTILKWITVFFVFLLLTIVWIKSIKEENKCDIHCKARERVAEICMSEDFLLNVSTSEYNGKQRSVRYICRNNRELSWTTSVRED